MGGSQSCWKATRLCESMRDYVRRNGLTHIFVGASAKVAGSSVKEFFALGQRHKGDHFAQIRLAQRCSWAITGSHMWSGLGSILKERCAPKTLLLLPVREEVSWMRSALGQVCWAQGRRRGANTTCGSPCWLMRALKE